MTRSRSYWEPLATLELHPGGLVPGPALASMPTALPLQSGQVDLTHEGPAGQLQNCCIGGVGHSKTRGDSARFEGIFCVTGQGVLGVFLREIGRYWGTVRAPPQAITWSDANGFLPVFKLLLNDAEDLALSLCSGGRVGTGLSILEKLDLL